MPPLPAEALRVSRRRPPVVCNALVGQGSGMDGSKISFLISWQRWRCSRFSARYEAMNQPPCRLSFRRTLSRPDFRKKVESRRKRHHRNIAGDLAVAIGVRKGGLPISVLSLFNCPAGPLPRGLFLLSCQTAFRSPIPGVLMTFCGRWLGPCAPSSSSLQVSGGDIRGSRT
jgi:hypothetical protein